MEHEITISAAEYEELIITAVPFDVFEEYPNGNRRIRFYERQIGTMVQNLRRGNAWEDHSLAELADGLYRLGAGSSGRG